MRRGKITFLDCAGGWKEGEYGFGPKYGPLLSSYHHWYRLLYKQLFRTRKNKLKLYTFPLLKMPITPGIKAKLGTVNYSNMSTDRVNLSVLYSEEVKEEYSEPIQDLTRRFFHHLVRHDQLVKGWFFYLPGFVLSSI
jgi:hypothetical protein